MDIFDSEQDPRLSTPDHRPAYPPLKSDIILVGDGRDRTSQPGFVLILQFVPALSKQHSTPRIPSFERLSPHPKDTIL